MATMCQAPASSKLPLVRRTAHSWDKAQVQSRRKGFVSSDSPFSNGNWILQASNRVGAIAFNSTCICMLPPSPNGLLSKTASLSLDRERDRENYIYIPKKNFQMRSLQIVHSSPHGQ